MSLSWPQWLLLGGSALVAGALNAVAGGGSFFSFPALVLCGVPPLQANATSTVALWPGSLGSAVGYRRELSLEREALGWLGGSSLLGGALGAWLLVRTPPRAFELLLPFLLLVASLVFTFGERVRQRLAGGAPLGGRGRLLLAAALQLPIATYGGYFGGGLGLLMLAAFTLAGMTRIHAMNGLKSVLAAVINGVAIGAFALAGLVSWTPAAIMVLAALAGGLLGASLARRASPKQVRSFATVVGWGMTAVFFVRTFWP